jgi:hypothetical protein
MAIRITTFMRELEDAPAYQAGADVRRRLGALCCYRWKLVPTLLGMNAGPKRVDMAC